MTTVFMGVGLTAFGGGWAVVASVHPAFRN